MIATGFLLGLMLLATVTDIQSQKIYNWTTYPGIGIAILLAVLGSTTNLTNVALVGIDQSLIGFLVAGGVMLLCFVLFQIGGGDVKLLAMVGAFLGPAAGIETVLWTFVLGGAMAMIILIWKLGAFNLARRFYQQAMNKLSIGKWGPLTDEEKKQLQMPLYLAPSATLGVIVVRFSMVNELLGI
jgi:prepilin peptidase CpaA